MASLNTLAEFFQNVTALVLVAGFIAYHGRLLSTGFPFFTQR